MLGNGAIVEAVVRTLEVRAERPFVVLDPVVCSSSGSALLDASGLEVLNERLLPLVGLVTPNLNEMPLLRVPESVAVLFKGGHAEGVECIDRLTHYRMGGIGSFLERVETVNTRERVAL